MLWLVSDVDRWGNKKLSEICRAAKQKHCQLAISNPCFEVWLCLHLLETLNSADRTPTHFKQRLREILGSHNSSSLDLSKFAPHIAVAVDRAQKLHPDDQQHWPQSIGTHVHRLVQAIIESL